MTKKNNLALIAFLIVGLFSLFTINISAQKTDSVKTEQSTKTCSGEKFVMPQTISVGNDAFVNYLKVASLPRAERGIAFGKLSNQQKASFVKVQFALQLVKRPNLTKEQRDFISEAMERVSADLYDKENPQKVALADELSQEMENKVFGLFVQKDAFEILEGLGVNKDKDIALLQKYEDLLKLGMQLRRNLVKEMPIIERVAIWKTQLAYHLATSSLNKQQKEFIVEFMPNVQSILEASLNQSEDDKAKTLEELESSMFKVFTKAEAYAVFMTIGIQNNVRDDSELEQSNVRYTSQNSLRPQIGRFNLSGISSLSLVSKNKLPQFLIASSAEACNCRWYCDPYGYSCGSYFCQPTYICGPLGDWRCTNVCGLSGP